MPAKNFGKRRLGGMAAVFLGSGLLLSAGCKTTRTDDPQLKPIQEMLDTQVPPGTTELKVRGFLESRGYAVVPSQNPGTIVAAICGVESQRNQSQRNPAVAARVTFYFDAHGKLNTFELRRAEDVPVHK